MRNALDLSTTTAPAFTACGAYSRAWAEPAEKKATSVPSKTPGPRGSTRICSPANVTVFPAERADANARRPATGNLRSSRILRVVCPTAPVAPTTAMLVMSRSSVRLLDVRRDQVAHLARADERRSRRVDGAGPIALLEHRVHGSLDAVGIRAAVERIAEQYRGRENGCDRIRHPLPRDVGRRAVHRLVEADPPAEARRWQHAHRSGEDGGLVRQDVPERVLGDDRVEMGRVLDQRHRAVVDEHVLER